MNTVDLPRTLEAKKAKLYRSHLSRPCEPLPIAGKDSEAATYPQATDAQAAVADLRREGFQERDISVIYTDAGHTIRAGMVSGAVWGGVLGALWGLLFPPIGLLVVAGPILGVFISGVGLAAARAVTVAALDGIISALVHLGMPREIATRLGERVHKGDALVIVHATNPNQAERACVILMAHHPRREDGISSSFARIWESNV